LNRAKSILAAPITLLSALSVLHGTAAHAQARGGADTRRPTPSAAASAPAASRAAAFVPQHTFYPANTSKVPASMTRRVLDSKSLGKATSRAPGDQAVTRQTILLTKLDPSLQYSYTVSNCNNQHPYWTVDEKYIYFDSNRNSDTDPSTRADGKFNLFRMFADGSGLSQLRSSTANEIEPCVSVDGNTVAYVAGGTLDYTNGLDNPASKGFALYTYNVSAGGAPVNLTASNPSKITFTDVRHPSYNPGGTKIVFQGQLGLGMPYHIFLVDLQTDVITQLTGPAPGTSAAVESNDTAPAWSPDGNLVAFTSNASGFTTPSPMAATALNPANQATPGDTNQYDIWVVAPNAFAPNPHRVTNSSSIVGGGVSSNKNPAWSTLKTDPLQVIPNETNPSGYVTSSANMLAFASTRANADPTNPQKATAVKPTYDIYFMHAKIAADPNLPGSVTVVTPEGTSNSPVKLPTTSPGTTFDPNYPSDPSYADPTFNFDPNFATNEDYPAWPQYVSSYRIAYQSDRGGSEQIWASTMIDINAPTLLKYDIPSNEIVHVARDSAPATSVREVAAGETVRFRVRAVDYESGIESVYLQIKDPNSGPQSADGLEHKVYYIGPGYLDNGPLYVVNAPYEIDAQAINPNTFAFRTPGSVSSTYADKAGELAPVHTNLPSTFPGWNQYVPGIDDLVAFSGAAHPPDDDAPGHDYTNQGGFWLRLYDDGPISLGGHEPEGETAGDGLYTGTWTTPASLPSDWILDVIVRDLALNPFYDPTNPNSSTNWKIYDNVWGFTTQPFAGSNGILYVNDYDCGQKFFQTNAGAFTNTGGRLGAAYGSFNSAQAGAPGTFYNGVPTESWMTEMDGSVIPQYAQQGITVYGLGNFLTNFGINSYTDSLTQEPGGVNPVPVTGRYDQWRIICRGPVPDSVLNAYKGHIEVQPADVLSGGTGPRQVFVAERCVMWHAPYSGDLFVGPGTILDADTEVRLANFVKTGGRLMLNGNDIAWGLTLGGGATNALLSSTFKVNYAADYAGVTIKAHLTDPPAVAPYVAPLSTQGRGTHPIIMETWYGSFHGYPGTVIPNDPPGASDFYLQTPPSGSPLRYYGAPNPVSADGVQFLGTSTLDASDYDATYGETGAAGITWVTDNSAAPIVSKAVFIAFGLEAVNPEKTGTVTLKNRRAEIIHNVSDYLRTGRIVGIVKDLNGNAPLKGVFLRALSNHRLNADGSAFVYSTTYTLSDGSYVLDGLDTYGSYTIDAFKPGYITSHGQGGLFHGGYQSKVDFYLSQARPGGISGTVTLQGSGAPAPGLFVLATDTTTGATFNATTATDGSYTITNVPASIYSVTVPKAPTGNLDTLGYGSCIAVGYTPSTPIAKPITVVPNATVAPVNFYVTPLPGTITGLVESHVANGNPNNIIPGATVTATDANNATYTAVTDSTGTYTISGLVPGSYTLNATASGYKPSQTVKVTVTTQATITQSFVDDPNFPNDPTKQLALTKAKPGGISGYITTSQGFPVIGATVTVTDSLGNVLTTVTTGATQTTGTYKYNYDTGMIVPAGAVVSVSAAKTGFTVVTPPANPQSVTISEGVESTGINFYLDPLHIFNPAISLVSAPYEYGQVSGGSVASLLNVPASDVTSNQFAFIAWDTANSKYVNYPTAPADTFHLGAGYFLQDSAAGANLSLATLGTPATPNTVFSIHLKPGWNLIGDPWSFPINFLNLKVVAADGTSSDVLTAQSGTNPSLGAALWGYDNNTYEVSYTLDPWKGYWIRAFDNRPASARGTAADIILLVDPSAQQNRGTASSDARFAITAGNNVSEGWKLNLSAAAGSANAAPVTLGVTRGATNSYDRFKLETPPVIGSQGVSVAVTHTDWTNKNGRYAVDLRSPGTAANSWNITVASTVPNQPVTLTWPAIATVSGKVDLVLTDVDTNTTVNLRSSTSYTMQPTAAGVTRHLQISSSAARRASLQIANVSARLTGGSAGTSRAVSAAAIGYTLTADATTQVSILKNGKLVRRIEQGVSRAAGQASLVWDLKNDQGVNVASDAYIVEVKAQDAQGHVARQVSPLVIVR
jgi:Carboxypeptidase regulatory-like domain/FlgD Ig-like domain/WD40-like Beta Propeller Repeat